MKKLSRIPFPEITEYDEAGLLGDSDDITERDLRQFDRQLAVLGFEVIVFENGSALNWFITSKDNLFE